MASRYAQPRITVWVQRFKDRPNLMLQWIDPVTGRRKSRSAETRDPDKAEQARADLEYELTHGTYVKPSKLTWEAFRDALEDEYLPRRAPGTRTVYHAALNLFEEICNPRLVRAISTRTVSAFEAGLRKRGGRKGGMEPSTIKVRLQFLHSVLAWGEEQGFLACPKFPVVAVPEKNPQPVPLESFERLLAKADQQMGAFLLCGWLAGLRRKEALALEWEQTDESPWVDLTANRIWLPAGFVKARKDQWVPLDPHLRQILLALPRHGKTVFRFVGRDGTRLSLTRVSSRVSELAKKARVKLTMKALRRGFGCRHAGRVPAQVLQKLMRHSDIKITMKYYANVDDAVEAAILGQERNSSRNTQPAAAATDNLRGDVNDAGVKGYREEGII
jgi:integrase